MPFCFFFHSFWVMKLSKVLSSTGSKLLIAVLASLFAIPCLAESWSYVDSSDKMRNIPIKLAGLDSENFVSPGSYYSDETKLSIVVRQHDQKQSALIRVFPKGQITCSYAGCNVTIKFDKEKPISWHMSRETNGRSDVLFFDNAPKLIARLKSSKTAIIEVSFFSLSSYQFEFLTSGLEWNQPSVKSKL